MSKKDDPEYVTAAICNERVKRLEGKIDDLKKRLETLDGRLWMMLAGIVISILLALLQFTKP